MNYIPVLTIAGSDSSGGAGIQADIKTLSSLGCYAASAITAITVQNTLGVSAVHAVPSEIVAGQIKTVMDDIHPKVIKIGMVNDAATIHAIAETLKGYRTEIQHLVIDPVMVATSGSPLMQPDALDTFKQELLPLATLLTPNLPEMEQLHNCKIQSAMLVKGGHAEGKEKIDILYAADGTKLATYTAPSIDTRNTHGTGCTLSSAIAAFLARGYDLQEAIDKAKEWLTQAIQAGADIHIGEGHGPVCHFFQPEKMIVKKPWSRLQFITHHNNRYSYLEGALTALEGGCWWIQLRMKEASDDEVREVANQLLPACRERGATFILDDRVLLAKELHADGVHLGKNDMPVNEARRLLGERCIIGGTANTFEDIQRLDSQGADYIGCGPFRFTKTKEKLAPTLGIEGYQYLMTQMREHGIHLPVVAIGGITLADVPAIMQTGVQGIAVSGAILDAVNPVETTKQFLNHSTHEQ